MSDSDDLVLMDAYATRCVSADEDPYLVANEAQGALTSQLESEAHAGQLYCIWAAITDRWEVGAWSEAAMCDELRRMSTDWLRVRRESDDVGGWVDHWYYDECGYDRK